MWGGKYYMFILHAVTAPCQPGSVINILHFNELILHTYRAI